VFAQTWTEPTVLPPAGNRPAALTLDDQGNLTLPGNLSAAGNLNVGGNFTFKIGNLTIVPEFYNGSEDSYSGTGVVYYTNTDTCDGSVNSSYSCKADENKTCWDIYDACVCCPYCGARYSQSITCTAAVRLISPVSSGGYRAF
jgi:hypothetical protein